jgi:NitT/TauT family transport system ATP-binding protein
MPISQGTIHIREQLVNEPFSDIGFVFQDPVLLPWRTVHENVLFSIEMIGLNKKEYEQHALELLDLTGLPGFETKFPSELSGGMQQRVAICRALVHDPNLLLMDEPFGALDAMTREEMIFELLRIWHKRRKTILFVTHSIPEAILLADRVIVLTARPGRIACLLDIDLPRPRHFEIEFSEKFRFYIEEIRKLIFMSNNRETA